MELNAWERASGYLSGSSSRVMLAPMVIQRRTTPFPFEMQKCSTPSLSSRTTGILFFWVQSLKFKVQVHAANNVTCRNENDGVSFDSGHNASLNMAISLKLSPLQTAMMVLVSCANVRLWVAQCDI